MEHLTFEQIIELHGDILEPAEPRGFDKGRVQSILGCIAGGVGDQLYHPTIVEAAAAYLFYFARDQAFDQGNKRTAVLACATFLDLNESPLTAEIDPTFVIQVGKGMTDKSVVVCYLQKLLGLPIGENSAEVSAGATENE